MNVWVPDCHDTPAEVRAQLVGAGSLYHVGPRDATQCQSWWQISLPDELSCQLLVEDSYIVTGDTGL